MGFYLTPTPAWVYRPVEVSLKPSKNMERREFVTSLSVLSGTLFCGCLHPEDGSDTEPVDTESDFAVETVADGLTTPWSIEFLTNPDTNHEESRILVTELPGRLRLIDRETGESRLLEGTPEVYDTGEGGLLDAAVHPRYPDERWVYLTYSARNRNGGSATHLGRGRLDPEEGLLSDFEVLHTAEPFVESANHYGSRVVFGDDGMVYMTSGDRQFKDFGPNHVAQDVTNELGAVLRLTPEGDIPGDNPFVDDPVARDSVYSYGHRNPQGLTVHPETGEIWESEHGEGDGDEINLIERGENYGWPVASESCQYGTTTPVGDGHDEVEDVAAPEYVWECGTGGFPPAGMTVYDGEAFPGWQGDIFVGNLAGQYLGHLEVKDREVTENEPLLDRRGWRVRDVEEAPDTGNLYLLVDSGDAPVVRLTPA